ncbi:MAG: VWA domain-containing protein, partial [Myxococcota bacterium]
IGSLEAEGSTALDAGLSLGLDLVASPTAGRSRRVVLLSDGLPDTAVGLDDLARRAARAESPLTTIGIGDDYDEALMQSLSDLGGGNFYWTRRGPELAQVLGMELGSARSTVATTVRARLDGGARIVDGGGVPLGSEGDLQLGSLFAGQHRSAWLTVELPPGSGALGTLALAFTDPNGGVASISAQIPSVTLTRDAGVAYAALGDTWADAVVTEDYNALRTAVSSAIQHGDRDTAVAAIAKYRIDNATVNQFANNPKVADNLDELQRLESEVNANFVGADQRARQNVWAKGTRMDASTKRQSGKLSLPMPAPAPSQRPPQP